MEHLDLKHILENNKGRIYRICRIYALSPIEPQDLFQEVIFQIWKSLPSFKGNSSIDTWVYRITVNVCLRSKLKLESTNTKTVGFDAIEYKTAVHAQDDEDSERYVYLRECISALGESDASIIVMHLEEFSYKQIAEVTGLTENHIAVKMKRIRKKLYECITTKS